MPTRSLTIVGDVAQTSTRAGARSWERTLEPLLRGSWRLEQLTVNYRTPATVAEAAQRVARAAGLPVSPSTSARDVPDALRVQAVPAAGLARRAAEVTVALVDEVQDASGAGRVAVVAAVADLPAVRAALAERATTPADAGGRPDLEAAVVVLDARAAKGLEFDAVVLVEPAAVLDEAPGDLYVAMTRPTRALHVLHARPLPAGLAGRR